MVGTRYRASGGAAAPPYQSIDEDEDGGILGGFDHILKLPVSRHRRFELGRDSGDGFEEAQQQAALDRVIHILRQRPARRQRRPRIQLGRHDADHVAPLIHQRPARIARLHRHADLKIPRVIPRAGQRRDFPLGQFRREPLQTNVGKTDRRHRAAQLRRPAG